MDVQGCAVHDRRSAIGSVQPHWPGTQWQVIGNLDRQSISRVQMQSRILQAIRRHKAEEFPSRRIEPVLVREAHLENSVGAEQCGWVSDHTGDGWAGAGV